jgi:8-oxo-dGTP diphosphatase
MGGWKQRPVRVMAGAILDGGRILLVSKRAAPSVFYLPGGKPDPGEEPAATLARELAEELGVALIHSEPLAVVSDQAALEPARLEMEVHLATVDGPQGGSPGVLAPAIRNHVLPRRSALGLVA